MIDKFPKISIVTPSYNQGKYLEETILSVINQQYPNLEYIIIDGGSTDNSVEIIKKYEKHLTYWVSEKDGGLYHGLQKGFERSTGEIMAWINSDDMYLKRSFFVVAKLFNNFPKVKWLMGKHTFYSEQGESFVYEGDRFHERWSKWRLYDFDGKFIQQESVFWRRELWEAADGYIDSSLALAGDFELWLRFFRHEKLFSTSFLLSGFRFRNGNQKSKDHFDEYIAEIRYLIKREKKRNRAMFYLTWCRIIKFLSRLIPIRKFRNMLIFKAYKIPPKIIFSAEKGFVLSKMNTVH